MAPAPLEHGDRAAHVGQQVAGVEPARAELAGRGRQRGRGRGAGYRHTELTKTKIKAALAKARKVKAERRQKDVLTAFCPSQAVGASRCLAGGPSKSAAAAPVAIIGGSAVFQQRVWRDRGERSHVDRALVSHVHSQSEGLAAFVRDSPGDQQDGVAWVFSTNTFDDASMWVSKPPDYDKFRRQFLPAPMRPTLQALGKRGRNVHIAVLNLQETVFVGRTFGGDGGQAAAPAFVTRAAPVQSPAQPLPVANIATVHDRWKRWTFLSSSGSAHQMTGNALAAVSPSVWKTVVLVKDNLVLNDGLVGLEEETLRLNGGRHFEATSGMTVLALSCAAHSVVLSMKPTFECLDNLPTMLVRLGHLMESARTSCRFDEELQKEVEASFVYKQVYRLPAECDEWRRGAVRVLETSRSARNLSAADEEQILSIANGDWNSEELTHYCVRGSCAAGCQGETSSKASFVACMKLAVAGRMTVPLLYRWKGFEQAVAWCFRGRRCFDLLRRVFARLYPPTVVRRATEEVAQAAARGGEAQAVNKNQIKGSVLRFFRTTSRAAPSRRPFSSTGLFKAT